MIVRRSYPLSVLISLRRGVLLDFLSLPPKIPSQVVQLIEKPATAGAREPEGSFGFKAQLFASAIPAFHPRSGGSGQTRLGDDRSRHPPLSELRAAETRE
jgi:hypothetical protein